MHRKGAFYIPFLRELNSRLDFIDIMKATLKYLAKHNLSAVIVLGGAEKSHYAYPGSTDLVLLKLKGFVKQAILYNSMLVPYLYTYLAKHHINIG